MLAPLLYDGLEPGWRVVGHERAVLMLGNSILNQRLGHAYLFTGPQGIGKRTLALEFASALNCLAGNGPNGSTRGQPCHLCQSCTRIARGSHPDVVEISLERQGLVESDGRAKTATPKEIKIDAIRGLQATVGLNPHSGAWKVYILGDAERLNEEASNALLKTLEEPPSSTVLLLLALDTEAVLPTIASRCFHVPLRPVRRAAIAAALMSMHGFERDKAEMLAALSGGRPGAALSLASAPDALDKRPAALQKLAAISGAHRVERVNAASDLAKMFTEDRRGFYDLLDHWESWWRDVVAVSSSQPSVAINVDQAPALRAAAERISTYAALNAVKLVEQTRLQLMENVNPRLALESLTLGLP